RVGGMSYTCDPSASMGKRIQDMRLGGKPLEAGKKYKVAGWAPVSAEARDAGGEPIWELVARYLRARKTLEAREPDLPKLLKVKGNPGIAG
ncbi:MAG TPA: 5'-nucleotidase C-terminal domain-containing protein, partial [Myxococcaceae bacterium]|nr:5'-nucleotidase C-terminal domain-containing protein [Myxococcaceae bacterium]